MNLLRPLAATGEPTHAARGESRNPRGTTVQAETPRPPVFGKETHAIAPAVAVSPSPDSKPGSGAFIFEMRLRLKEIRLQALRPCRPSFRAD
jgi:hypothetical protein